MSAGGIRLAGRARIVHGPRVSVRSQQCLDDVVSVLLRSEHQGRVAVEVPGLTVCAHLQETLDVCDVALTGRSEQRRVSARVPPIWGTRLV